jgi:hypothetical protein
MNIEIGKYMIKSTVNGDYDLVEKVVRNKTTKDKNGKLVTTGETYEGENDLAYNMSFEFCVNKIIKLNLHDMDLKCDLNTFLSLYKDEVNKVTQMYGLYEKVS